MRPPLYARALLFAVAGQTEAECVAGDLEEEFPHVCLAHGRGAGNRWYAWQVFRSVLPLLGLRMRSGELTGIVLGAALVALPLLLLDRLWCFVYSQIPLKDGLDRAPEFLAVNVIAVCVCAAIAGWRTKSVAGTWGRAVVASIAAGLAVWASAGGAPAAYGLLVMVAAPAGSLATFVWRRSR